MVLFEVSDQMVEVLHLFSEHNVVHLLEDRLIFLLQSLLVHGQLLLTQHQGVMLLLNLVDKISDQALQFNVKLVNLLVLSFLLRVSTILVQL